MEFKRKIGELWDGTSVYLVDGDRVRDELDSNFAEGGHSYVDDESIDGDIHTYKYDYIPKDEIWVEEMINKFDQAVNLAHEIYEYSLQKYLKFKYGDSHDKALSIDDLLRACFKANGVAAVEERFRLNPKSLLVDIYKIVGQVLEADDNSETDGIDKDVFNNVYVTVSKKKLSDKNDPGDELDALKDIDKAFEDNGFKKPTRIYTYDDPVDFVNKLNEEKPSVIINNYEYFEDLNSKRINTTNLFDFLQIPYTGGDSFALSLTTDKFTSKAVMAGAGIRTALSREFKVGEEPNVEGLEFPLFVKPVNEDGSAGIDEKSIVENEDELKTKVKEIHDKIKDSALVEEYLDGKELSVFIIGNGDNRKVLPIAEIDYSKLPKGFSHISNQNSKSDKDSVEYKSIEPKAPADITEELKEQLSNYAMKAYDIFRCRDYARFDFRLSKSGNPFMIEVNVNPDISDTYVFEVIRKASGMELFGMLKMIINEAVNRNDK